MTIQQINNLFLQRASGAVRSTVLQVIAKHYGTDKAAIEQELTHPEAEHLLDYIPDAATRKATQAVLIGLGLR